MKRFLLPWARGAKHAVLKYRAERRIRATPRADSHTGQLRTAFVVGCGRSGTTMLGEIIAGHAHVKYFFEPYHLWATVDPVLDVLNRHHVGPNKFLVDHQDADAEAKRRFNRLFIDPAFRAGALLMVEKTPMNACRIGYLEALTQGARYLHLVRDGTDVSRSIDRLSQDRNFKIIGMPGLNRWWGRNDSKWKAMTADGTAAGYFSDELSLVNDFAARGAYEWLFTLEEIDRWRPRLKDRLLEMTYDQLTGDPQKSIMMICKFLNLPMTGNWLETSMAKIDKPHRNEGPTLVLPPGMCEAFNRMQGRYGFPGRAASREPQPVRSAPPPAATLAEVYAGSYPLPPQG
jgi:hypothetical protein